MTFAFGIFDSFDLGAPAPGGLLDDRLDFVELAEREGIDHYHVTEHHGTPLSVCPSPNLFLAAASQRTSTMRLGPLVYVLPGYEPLRLAEEIATLDQLTGGRLDVGVGRGVSPYELAYLGVDPARARDIFTETLEVLRAALATGRMTHRGTLLRDYDVTLSVRPVQRPHPPLWYASSNSRSAEWAGRNGVNFVGKWNDGALVPAIRSYWDAWCLAHGDSDVFPPRVGIQCPVLIADTDQEARERYYRANEVFGRKLTKLWHDHDDHAVDAVVDARSSIRVGNSLVGSVATVRDALLARVDEAPITFFEGMFWFGDLDRHEGAANLRAFTAEIAPAVRERAAARLAWEATGTPGELPAGHRGQ